MDKLEKFIGADKIFEEAPDLKAITDNLRQYPVIAVFAALLYRFSPQTFFENTIFTIWASLLMLVAALVLVQTTWLWMALVFHVTSLGTRGALTKMMILSGTFVFGMVTFYSLVFFLIKLLARS